MNSITPPPNEQPGQQAGEQAQQVPPQHEVPPQYQAPQQPSYGQQEYGQQQGYTPQPPAAPGSNLQLNYWLSVFFAFIPSLIFYFTEKGKDARVDAYNRDNLNFTLVRAIPWLASVVLGGIPILGWLIAGVMALAGIVLFVMHIMAAVKIKENFDQGRPPGFPFNVQFIK